MNYSNNQRGPISVTVLIIIDIIIAGAALCVFALFHHVLPMTLEADPAPAVTDNSGETVENTPAVGNTLSDWYVKYKDKFTSGEIEKDAMSYRSANLSVETSCVQSNGITYYLQDIYVTSLDCLRTAFAKDTFGKGINQATLVMAENNNAIAAVNGDYYGTHSNRGVVIRNGEVYRWQTAFNDVCILYEDGTVKQFDESYYNENSATVITEAWQGWCFGPSLVIDGEAVTSFDSDIAGVNPRTAFGYFEPGHYCFVVVDGRQEYSDGITLADFALLMKEAGCIQAYNLDGGKSSVMTFGGSVMNSPVEGGREVSDIVYIAEPEDDGQ